MDDTARRRGIFAIFALHALAGGGIFPRVPDIQLRLGLGEAELGLLLMTAPLAGLVSFFFASWLVERAGTGRIIHWCLIGMALSLVGLGAAAHVSVAAIMLAGFGLTFSISNVAINVEADRIEASSQMSIMNRCHGLWSVGFLVIALYGAGARALPISPLLQFALSAPIVIIAVVWVMKRFVPSPPRAHRGTELKRPTIPWPSRAAWGVVGFGIVGSIAQSANSNWSVIFMRDEFNATALVEGLSIPCFLVALTVGRLMGDRLIEVLGRKRLARLSVLSSALGFAMIAVAPSVWVAMIGFTLTGFGTAVMFPLMMSAAAKLGDKPATQNVASVTMVLAFLMLSAPVLMGAIAEFAGLRLAFASFLPLFLLSYFSARAVFDPPSEADLSA